MGWKNLLLNPKTAGKVIDRVKPLKKIKGSMTTGEVKMKAGLSKMKAAAFDLKQTLKKTDDNLKETVKKARKNLETAKKIFGDK
tara:strand:- start:687 stop:938 length:252 start_codon:yes stop_codon:yes gene_type:complete